MLEKTLFWPQARLIAFGTALLDDGAHDSQSMSVAALRGAWCEQVCLIQSVSKFSRCPLPSNKIVGEFLCALADTTKRGGCAVKLLVDFCVAAAKRRRQTCRIGG